MRRTRRSFTPEYRFTAAHRVIDGKERVVDVARELNLNDSVLHTWVRDERWRMSEPPRVRCTRGYGCAAS
ncbi:transposase, partial [Mycobacterium avium]